MSTLTGVVLADFTTSLATAGVVGGTTATLQSATDDDAVALPSGVYYFTLDGSNSSKEHIQCSLVGTALTNIKSVSRQGVMTTGFARAHRLGATVTLTDFAHLKVINDLINGTTSLNSSAPLGYDGAPASLTGNQLATVTYVLGVVNGGAVTFDLQIISGQTSGEALTINDIVYFKESDAKWYKVDADLTTTFDQLQMGVNKTTAAGTGITIQVAISGPVTGFSGLTPGSKYYASNTAGAITTTAGTYSVFVGWALSATILLFNPIYKTLPTQKEKDAMVGSTGVPSSTNKYVTQDNTSSATTDQTQTTQNSTIETGEADATGKKNLIAQSFIPAYTKIRGFNLYKSADTGAFTGTVVVTLQADTAGSPSGTPLATRTFTNTEWVSFSVGEIEGIFTTEYASMVAGSLYWLVIDPSTSDNSNHPNLGTNTAGGYTSGSVKYKNTTDGWVAVSTIDLYFKTLQGTASQVVIANASGKIENTFYDLTEMPIPAFQQTLPTTLSTADPATSAAAYIFGSSQDGSVLYTAFYRGAPYLSRKVRSSTGIYETTHEQAVTMSSWSQYQGSIIVIGSYIYVVCNGGAAAVKIFRFLAADLTGETAMTVPVLSAGSGVCAWTDGTFAYVMSASVSTTTWNKWSVSAGTFSAVTTGSLVSDMGFAHGHVLFDGINLYSIYAPSTGMMSTFTIKKFSDIVGTSLTSTTSKYINKTCGSNSAIGDNIGMPIAINIDTTRMYYGYVGQIYNAAAVYTSIMTLIPIVKP